MVLVSNRPTTAFRLEYEVPRVDPGEPEVGYLGGDPVEDENGEIEFTHRVTYLWSRGSLDRKLRWLANWSNAMQLDWEQPVAGRVLSIEFSGVVWETAFDSPERVS